MTTKRRIGPLARGFAAILVVLLIGVSPIQAKNNFSVEAAFNYEITQWSVFYGPDPNGGIGFTVMTDSAIPEGTADNVAIGPKVQFSLDNAYQAIFSTILPFIHLPNNLPFKLYGQMALTFETGAGRAKTGIFGTKACFLPSKRVQPIIVAEYILPEGNSDISEGFSTLFGVAFLF